MNIAVGTEYRASEKERKERNRHLTQI